MHRSRGRGPEPIGQILGRVVDDMGGALLEPRDDRPGLESVIAPELAARTRLVIRDNELRVYAGSSTDATLLKFERANIARWARESFGLGTEPNVVVLIGRPSEGD